MKLAMIGTGYVGLVSGTCFAEFGVHVTCVDQNAQKIAYLKSGKSPIFEPGLEALITGNQAKGRLHFTTDLKAAVAQADVVFIAVGTPSRRGDGHADLSFVYTAAQEIASSMQGYTVIVTKSTVPVGTGRRVFDHIQHLQPKGNFDVVSNPEFLREGSAIHDFMRPDRVVIGTNSEHAKEIMSQLYRPLYLLETPMVFTSLESAEFIKYAANAFLATKISFINEMADLCEQCGADIQSVATGIGLDKRIGNKFLHTGPGYGGSCFPKDTLALVRSAAEYHVPLPIVETVVASNTARKKRMAQKVTQILGEDLTNKTLAVLGLTFKPNTDDMRDSPSLDILPELLKRQARLRLFDPEGMKEAQRFLSDPTLFWAKDAYDAMQGAHAVLILTEWNEFRALDWALAQSLLKSPVVIDLRNIYSLSEMEKTGLTYVSVGRRIVVPNLSSELDQSPLPLRRSSHTIRREP